MLLAGYLSNSQVESDHSQRLTLGSSFNLYFPYMPVEPDTDTMISRSSFVFFFLFFCKLAVTIFMCQLSEQCVNVSLITQNVFI